MTNCTESNLRSAVAGGGTVTFACDGTITLAATITNTADTVLDGGDHQIAISGGDTVRVFTVATNVSLAVVNLTIANGRSERGGGIYNEGGSVNLRQTAFHSNWALAAGGWGGALYNWGGVINATNCEFAGNVAQSMTNSLAEHAGGGAIFNHAGSVNLQNCVFNGNKACAALESGYPAYLPGPGMSGSNGLGGAICNFGSLRINSCTFRDNLAGGGMGGPGIPGGDYPFGNNDPPFWGGYGGNGYGGAIFNTGLLVVEASLFVGNQVTGGIGGTGGRGGFALYSSNSGAWGGGGGDGFGAALASSNGIVRIGNCTVVSNTCAGGIGGTGGQGGEVVKGYGGTGGTGGMGGRGIGAINAHDDCRITNCTIAFNTGIAGNVGSGGRGGWSGLYLEFGSQGSPGAAGSATGGVTTTACRLVNTLLATNAPGGNCHGTITDDGHNLSSDSSCAFTNVGSLNNTDPLLGPLANNGGPTLTMALLAGSPAIDASDSAAAPPTDQRGAPRPFGAGADIGAYEYAAMLSISRASGNGLDIFLRDGSPGQTCRLLTSTNCLDWVCVATNQVGASGTVLFRENCSTAEPERFYKAVLP